MASGHTKATRDSVAGVVALYGIRLHSSCSMFDCVCGGQEHRILAFIAWVVVTCGCGPGAVAGAGAGAWRGARGRYNSWIAANFIILQLIYCNIYCNVC